MDGICGIGSNHWANCIPFRDSMIAMNSNVVYIILQVEQLLLRDLHMYQISKETPQFKKLLSNFVFREMSPSTSY